jgi:hypothetical protein
MAPAHPVPPRLRSSQRELPQSASGQWNFQGLPQASRLPREAGRPLAMAPAHLALLLPQVSARRRVLPLSAAVKLRRLGLAQGHRQAREPRQAFRLGLHPPVPARPPFLGRRLPEPRPLAWEERTEPPRDSRTSSSG